MYLKTRKIPNLYTDQLLNMLAECAKTMPKGHEIFEVYLTNEELHGLWAERSLLYGETVIKFYTTMKLYVHQIMDYVTFVIKPA